jgi:tetratricopeptide (TPR) repeat protein
MEENRPPQVIPVSDVSQEEPFPIIDPPKQTSASRKNKLTLARLAKSIRVWALNFIVVFLVVVLLKVVIQEIYNKGYHIRALRVPQEVELSGYDGVTASYMMLDDVNRMISIGNRNRNTKDVEEYKQSAERNQLQVEVAGVGISPETISSYIKQAIGIKSKSIGGEIVRQGNTLKFFLRIGGWPMETFTQKIDSAGVASAVEKIIQQGAESVLKRSYPLLLGYYYFTMIDEKAIDAFHYTIQSQPDQAADAYAMLAAYTCFYISNRDSTSAMPLIRKSLTIDPLNSTAYGAWGIIEDLAGNSAKSEELLRKAVQLDPTNISSRENLGVKLYFLGKDDEAISCFEKCYSLDNTYTRSLSYWTYLLFEQGKISEANEKLEKLRYLESSEGNDLAIAIPLAEGDTTLAMVNFRKAKEKTSLDELMGGLNTLADHLKRRKNYDLSFKLLRFALRQDSASKVATIPFVTLAELYGLTAQEEKFYSNLEKSFKLGFRPHQANLIKDEPYKTFASADRYKKLIAKYKIK